MDLEQAERVLAELSSSFPQRSFDDPQVAVWHDTLRDLDVVAAIAAVRRLRLESEWMPSHARFIAVTEQERRRLVGQEDERQRALPRGELTSCPECQGDLWVGMGNAPNAYRPCSRCQPVQWVRWKEGHLSSDHLNSGACTECHDLKRGGTAAKEATEAIMGRYRRAMEPI